MEIGCQKSNHIHWVTQNQESTQRYWWCEMSIAFDYAKQATKVNEIRHYISPGYRLTVK